MEQLKQTLHNMTDGKEDSKKMEDKCTTLTVHMKKLQVPILVIKRC